MAQSARSKTLIDEPKYRDHNAGIYTETEGDVTKTFSLYWDHIYSIFDNDDLSEVENDVQAFQNITKSQIHAIVACPAIMPYTEVVHWLVELADPNTQMFRDASKSPLVSFKPEVIARMYPSRAPNSYSLKNF